MTSSPQALCPSKRKLINTLLFLPEHLETSSIAKKKWTIVIAKHNLVLRVMVNKSQREKKVDFLC